MPSHVLTLQSVALGPEESLDAREMPTGVEGVQRASRFFSVYLGNREKNIPFLHAPPSAEGLVSPQR